MHRIVKLVVVSLVLCCLLAVPHSSRCLVAAAASEDDAPPPSWELFFELDDPSLRHSGKGIGERNHEHYTCFGNHCSHWHLPLKVTCRGTPASDDISSVVDRTVALPRTLRLSRNAVTWQCHATAPDNFPKHFTYERFEVKCPEHPLEKARTLALSALGLANTDDEPSQSYGSTRKKHTKGQKDVPRKEKDNNNDIANTTEEEEGGKSPSLSRSQLVTLIGGTALKARDETESTGKEEEGIAPKWVDSCHLEFHIVNHGPLHLKIALFSLFGVVIMFIAVMGFAVGGRWYQKEVVRARVNRHFDSFEAELMAKRGSSGGRVAASDGDGDIEGMMSRVRYGNAGGGGGGAGDRASTRQSTAVGGGGGVGADYRRFAAEDPKVYITPRDRGNPGGTSSMKQRIVEASMSKEHYQRSTGLPVANSQGVLQGRGAGAGRNAFENPEDLSLGELLRRERGQSSPSSPSARQRGGAGRNASPPAGAHSPNNGDGGGGAVGIHVPDGNTFEIDAPWTS